MTESKYYASKTYRGYSRIIYPKFRILYHFKIGYKSAKPADIYVSKITLREKCHYCISPIIRYLRKRDSNPSNLHCTYYKDTDAVTE